MDEIAEKQVDKRSIALEHLKNYFEDFYNRNAALNPNLIRSLQYFLDWLKTATVDDIQVKDAELYLRVCEMYVEVQYFWKVGSSSYTDYVHKKTNLTAYITNDQYFANLLSDVYYSPEGNTKIVPANIGSIATSEAKKALYKADRTAIFSDARLLQCDVGEPVKQSYLDCVVTFPDKTGANTKTFRFLVWNDRFLSDEPYPGGPSSSSSKKQGCYIATSVYGSYNCPQVWTLRRYRDNVLHSTWYGRAFIKLYYFISPTLVKIFGKTRLFNKIFKSRLDKLVKKLNDEGVQSTPYDDLY